MDRIQAINLFIEKRGYSRYLEIGCLADECFSRVQVETKIGVDPVSGGTVRKTSDAFFAEAIAAGERFDIIFIDGLHHHDQVYRDIDNSLTCLAPGGAILMHDCLPPNQIYETSAFCWTAWRAFVQFRKRLDLDAIVGDFDFGVGLIRKVSNLLPLVLDKSMDEINYDDFVANRDTWMRPVSPTVFQILAEQNW